MSHPLLPQIQSLVDARIEEARLRGEFDNLPGAGKPLPEEDMSVPEELRLAHRILKNAGVLPPELGELSEINQLMTALDRSDLGGGDRDTASRRLRALLTKLELSGKPATARVLWQQYEDQLRDRYRDD
ncbi:MAG TPA: DUF1992 domain-containing protein [Burkholderiaceae bacterium]|nr:DUF1992 domain-containing protein [Burkholderiaceae bacterium]